MIAAKLLGRETFDVPCTIEIQNTHESLHAHVDLEGGVIIQPGDEVLVHGDPIRVPFGEKVTLKRNATVTRANALQRALTKIAARLEFTELYEVSFSSGRKL
jgi:flagellar basal body rod protein FlgF